MNIVLATLCLNEMEWLPRLYEQHRGWPGVVKWVFVEAADKVYQETNPSLVSSTGLSVDGTSEYLLSLYNANNPFIEYIPHGLSSHTDPAQGKCAARQRYLDVCEGMNPRPDWLIVIDGDEFYTRKDQLSINKLLQQSPSNFQGLVLKQRHIWLPPSISSSGSANLFLREVVGGYWDIPHCRIWRYSRGMKYTNNHNTPEDHTGRSFKACLKRFDKLPHPQFGGQWPECIHMGYASLPDSRVAKHRYYVARGEGKEQGILGKHRSMYVACRAAYEAWQEGDKLPHGARVIDYDGPIPECFVRDTAHV